MKYQRVKNGFTLLEVAISLGLIVMVFGSVTSLAILTRESEQSAKNNLIAAYLAKEAEELVRYHRDKNYLQGSLPFSGISNTHYTTGDMFYFLIDYTDTISEISESDVKLVSPLKVDNGFYNQTTGEDTIFRRLVTTTFHEAASPMPAYIDVKVEVYWKNDNKRNTYTLTSQLTDWR